MTATESASAWGQRLEACQQAIEYRFQDQDLLRRCLTHSSSAPTRLESNERLEFLGDAVLGLVVCDFLYRRFPQCPEGELTRIKSIVVSRTTCAQLSDELGLGDCLSLGKGLGHGQKVPRSILADVFESLVAGLFLDGGLEPVEMLVKRCLVERIEQEAEAETRNYKHLLQQLAQKKFTQTPDYQLLDEQGPDHAKCFQISAVIGEDFFPPAWGVSKKEAEQAAAFNALGELGALEHFDAPLPLPSAEMSDEPAHGEAAADDLSAADGVDRRVTTSEFGAGVFEDPDTNRTE